jgi:hypothetical protein
MTATVKLSKTAPHFKSDLRNFIATLDFKEISRKTMSKNGRQEYNYPIGDNEGFHRIFQSMLAEDPKTYRADGRTFNINAKNLPNKAMLGMAVYGENSQPSILYLQEIIPMNNELRGTLRISFAEECVESDLEALKRELLRFFD